MKTKYCNKCKETKPVSDFNRRYDTKSICYQSICKLCRSQKDAEYRKSEKGKAVIRKALYKWRKNHPDTYRAVEKRAKSTRMAYKHSDEGRLVGRMARARRRARVKELPHTLTKHEWLQIIESQGHRCKHCGEKKKLEQDHIVPVVMGGGYVKENIQGLCRQCNARKGTS